LDWGVLPYVPNGNFGTTIARNLGIFGDCGMLNKRLQNAIWVALFACMVVGYGFAVWSQHPRQAPQVQAKHQTQEHSQATDSRAGPHASEVTVLGIRVGEGTLALATILLVLATWALVREAKSTAQHQLRAYVSVVVGGAASQDTDKGVGFRGHPRIVNTGKTPAHGLTYWARAEIVKYPIPENFVWQPPSNARWEQPVTLNPGHHVFARAVVPTLIDEAEVEAVKRGDSGRRLCIWGVAVYRDTFNKQQQIVFSQSLVWLPDGRVWGNYERYNWGT
jgi:hypothetical protein